VLPRPIWSRLACGWSLLCIALVLVTFAVTPRTAYAANVCVPAMVAGCASSQPSIQAAVDSAAPGDTVTIAPGLYNEAVTIPPSKSNLILRGAQAGVDGRTRTIPPSPATETIISRGIINTTLLTIRATNVEVDGIVFQGDLTNATTTISRGISIAEPDNVDQVRMLNNIFHHINEGAIYGVHGPVGSIVRRNAFDHIGFRSDPNSTGGSTLLAT
jgi:hypothetical protein